MLIDFLGPENRPMQQRRDGIQVVPARSSDQSLCREALGLGKTIRLVVIRLLWVTLMVL